MKTLRHHGIDESKAHSDTQIVRRTHYLTCGWYSTTQVWSWDGGDAIVVMTGKLDRAEAVVIIRIGDQVHAVRDASVSSAMDAFGLESNSYKIVPGSA